MEEDVADSSTTATQELSPLQNQEQRRWDDRDAQAHALIAMLVKHRSIFSHIRS